MLTNCQNNLITEILFTRSRSVQIFCFQSVDPVIVLDLFNMYFVQRFLRIVIVTESKDSAETPWIVRLLNLCCLPRIGFPLISHFVSHNEFRRPPVLCLNINSFYLLPEASTTSISSAIITHGCSRAFLMLIVTRCCWCHLIHFIGVRELAFLLSQTQWLLRNSMNSSLWP